MRRTKVGAPCGNLRGAERDAIVQPIRGHRRLRVIFQALHYCRLCVCEGRACCEEDQDELCRKPTAWR